MAGDLAVAQDLAGNLKPVRTRALSAIDGIVAIIMAIGGARVAKEQVMDTPMAVWA